jgi:hypothetical protein
MDVYRNQMYRSGQEVAQKAKNPNYRFSNAYNMGVQHYGGLPPAPPVAPATSAAAGSQTATQTNAAAQQAIYDKYHAQMQAIK